MAKRKEVHITTTNGRPLCQVPFGVQDYLTGGKGTLQCGYKNRESAERALTYVGAMNRANFVIVDGQCPAFKNRRKTEAEEDRRREAEEARMEAVAKEKLAEVFEDADLFDEEAAI